MKLRCKGCQKKIELTDYNCPFCGKVNYSTDGEPEDFIRESVSLCDMLYRSACEGHSSYRDELTFKLTCGEMMFNCDRSRYAETNVLFDYSELELFGLKSLTVHTDKMTDEEKQRLNGASYPFELITE